MKFVQIFYKVASFTACVCFLNQIITVSSFSNNNSSGVSFGNREGETCNILDSPRDVCKTCGIFGEFPELFPITIGFCLGAELPILDATSQEICRCDCLRVHSATNGYELCVESEQGHLAGCLCKYKSSDRTCIAASAKANSTSSIRESEDEEEEVLTDITDAFCDNVAGVVTPILLCALTEPVEYKGKTYDSGELCKLDCLCNHGSSTPPYGECQQISEGKSTCVCCM